jgi:hypothetical protein
MAADPRWVHLGTLLVRRRVEMNPRFRNRRTFAAERKIEYRYVSDIERAARSNFEAQTIAQFEIAYDLPAGAIERAIATGVLVTGDDVPEPVPAPEPENTDLAYVRKSLPHLEPAHLAVLAGLVKSWIEPIPPAVDQRHTA